MSNKDAAAKFDVLKNNLSTWVNNKEKLLDSLEKRSSIKRQVDKAIFNWFLSMQSQNAIVQEKALTFPNK